MRCEIYPSHQCELIPKGDVVAIEANHILGLPLTISTRGVEPMTSKEMISDEVLVLAKSRFKKGSRKPEDLMIKSHKGWDVFQEHSL